MLDYFIIFGLLFLGLTGNYRAEHLFCLKQSLELYDLFQEKIQACDCEIESKMAKFATDSRVVDVSANELSPSKKKSSKNSPDFNSGNWGVRTEGCGGNNLECFGRTRRNI